MVNIHLGIVLGILSGVNVSSNCYDDVLVFNFKKDKKQPPIIRQYLLTHCLLLKLGNT